MMTTRKVLTWVLVLTLGFFMIAGGAAKLAGDLAMLDLFSRIGVGQWFRYVVGCLEVLGGLGLFLARSRAVAATALTLLLVCATLVTSR